MTIDTSNPIVICETVLFSFTQNIQLLAPQITSSWQAEFTKQQNFKQTRLPSSWLYMASLHNRITVCLVAVVKVEELMMTIMLIFIWVILVHVASALYSPCKTQIFSARKPELYGIYQ
jgi:hypothetical protein